MGWTASASASYSTDTDLSWRATLRRSAFGGDLEIYARRTAASSDEDGDFAFGLRFTKRFNDERPVTVTTSIEREDGQSVGRVSYDSAAPRGEGVFYGASIESDDLFAPATSATEVSANVGRQDDILYASGSASYSEATGATTLDLNAASGFVWTDGQFVLTRTARSGGVFASGLAPGSTVVGDSGTIGAVDWLGQAHLNSLARGEKSRVVLDEGTVDGGTGSREAEFLVVPGLIYGVGDSYRHLTRTFELAIGADRVAPPPGLVILDEDDKEVGYAGYDGIVTVDGLAKELHFENAEQTCRVTITGDEAVTDGLPQLVAACAPQAGG
jgi:outer membrane usher protein FimD/PapC